MKLDIISKNKNPLFNREEIEFKITDSDATPSRADTRKLILSSINIKNENLLVIKKIESIFGNNASKGYAFIYNNEESLKKLEPSFIIKRNQVKEKAASEEKKEPSEEKKEQPKQESKPEEKPAKSAPEQSAESKSESSSEEKQTEEKKEEKE